MKTIGYCVSANYKAKIIGIIDIIHLSYISTNWNLYI